MNIGMYVRVMGPQSSPQMLTECARITEAAGLDDPALQLVDIRDARELEREGTLPGAINAPRGRHSATRSPAAPSASSLRASRFDH